jgi:hypothetical protein
MKKLLYLFIVLGLFACGSSDDNNNNNISELVGIYEVVWVNDTAFEEESNVIDFCPGTLEFKSDNTVESVADDYDGGGICGHAVWRVSRTYEITLDGSNVIRGDIGTGEGDVLSATLNGVDMMGSLDLSEDVYRITFEYNKNTEELINNLYLEWDDLIVYMYQKL